MSNTNIETDLQITNAGGAGFFIIQACTPRGCDWLKANVPDQSDGTAYSDDRAMTWDIYQGALGAGLEVSA